MYLLSTDRTKRIVSYNLEASFSHRFSLCFAGGFRKFVRVLVCVCVRERERVCVCVVMFILYHEMIVLKQYNSENSNHC